MRYTIIIFFIVLSSVASASEYFILKNIKISASNKVASIARNEAIESGQLKAFNALIKMHYPNANDKVASIDREDILSLVESYELSDERRSALNYSAKMKIKFSKKHVENLMNNLGVVYFEGDFNKTDLPNQVSSKILADTSGVNNSSHNFVNNNLTTLILPVYTNSEGQFWLEDKNVLFNYFQSQNLDKSFVIPIGDLEDLKFLNKNILEKNLLDLNPILEKYGANNIAVLWLNESILNNTCTLSLKINYINRYYFSWQSFEFANITGNEINPIFGKYFSYLQHFDFLLKKQSSVINYNLVNKFKIDAEFQIEKITDWLNLLKMFSSDEYVEDVNLIKINKKLYTFTFISKISLNDLVQYFKDKGLLLVKNSNKFYLKKEEVNLEN